MKLALINPGKRNYHLTPPSNLCYLAAYVRAKSTWDMVILDEPAGVDVKRELKTLDPDVIGITATTCYADEAYEIADFCKKELSKTVIMGGVHASALPREALLHVDAVVTGEGEQALLELLMKIENGHTPCQEIIEGPFIKNLDDLPLPAWDLIDLKFYLTSKQNSANSINFVPRSTPTGALITSRGCPYSCVFCYNSKKKIPVRYHSAERVLEEIDFLQKNYGIKAIFFFDDEFIVNKSRLKAICQTLAEKHAPLRWACQARADLLNEETLLLMKKAGCVMVGLGFESAVQRILDLLNKKIKVEDHKRAIELCKKTGIKIYANFIFGTPTETREEMLQTLQFIEEHKLRYVSIAIATPFPGTVLWDTAKELNLLPDPLDYSALDLGSLTICNTMSKEDFLDFFHYAGVQLGISIRRKSLYELFTLFIKDPLKGIKKLKEAQAVRKQLIGKFLSKLKGEE
jgi:anaerobic magnesium-protoporphyrin IX monomethyl ester cyclase